MIKRAKRVTDVPCAVGFGISTPEQARDMAAVSDGVIIGSAIVKIIAEHGARCVEPVIEFVNSIKKVI
jgi:tryptophan synthase alpha chain